MKSKIIRYLCMLLATTLVAGACSRSRPAPVEIERKQAKLPERQTRDRSEDRPLTGGEPSSIDRDGRSADSNNAAVDSSQTGPRIDRPSMDPQSGGSASNAVQGVPTPQPSTAQPGSAPARQSWDGTADLVEDTSLRIAP
jgi:hypothetical protein